MAYHEPIKLSIEKRQDFYLIFKEAVNNLVKHAGASEARLRISLENKQMLMERNGLRNMQSRAKGLGGGPMSPGIARRVLRTFLHGSPSQRQEYGITPREHELLELLALGYTYRMIGIQCSISVETVRRHLKNIYHKLHVKYGTEAVAKALRERII